MEYGEGQGGEGRMRDGPGNSYGRGDQKAKEVKSRRLIGVVIRM